MSAKSNQVEKKQGFMAKASKFFKGAWNEFKKVHWPNKQELIAYTGVVFVTVFFVAFLIWIIDAGLTFLLELLI